MILIYKTVTAVCAFLTVSGHFYFFCSLALIYFNLFFQLLHVKE